MALCGASAYYRNKTKQATGDDAVEAMIMRIKQPVTPVASATDVSATLLAA